MGWHRLVAAWIPRCLLGVTLSACATAPRTAESEAAGRVARGVVRAEAAVHTSERLVTVLRFNPSPCAAPSWEARWGTRWIRVLLVPAREAGDEVGTILAGSGIGLGAIFQADLHPTGRSQATTAGWRFPVVEVSRMALRLHEP